MEYCPDHKDMISKWLGISIALAHLEERGKALDDNYEFLKNEIYEGENSIKGRIKASEIMLDDLKEAVLSNRKAVMDKVNEYKTETADKIDHLFNIFVIALSAASVILILVLGYLTYEVRSTNSAMTAHMIDANKAWHGNSSVHPQDKAKEVQDGR